MQQKNLTNQRFGLLKAEEIVGVDRHRNSLWKCLCDCGREVIIRSAHLLSGNSTSCGCKKGNLFSVHKSIAFRKRLRGVALSSKTHGMSNTDFYNRWHYMWVRCTTKSFKYHYGKGIKICERWKKFENFRDDMYEFFNKHVDTFGLKRTTLDRIDGSKGYSPENCRWATWEVQNRNLSLRETK